MAAAGEVMEMAQIPGDNPEAGEAHAYTRREQLAEAQLQYNRERQRFDLSPTTRQLLGRFDIFCLVLNRTIGSGIFTVPPKVLAGTGSVGASLLIWLAGGIVILCATLCWLELGLTIPMHTVNDGGIIRKVSAPRSGGEKNYLEYIYKKPAYLMTAIFGIMFVVLGNLAGNMVSFGIYVMIAAGKDPINDSTNDYEKKNVIGLAILVVTLCCSLHIFSRRGGIFVNNCFAMAKLGLLLAISLLGFVHAGRKYLVSHGINEPSPMSNITSGMINNATKTNFDTKTSFASPQDFNSFTESLLYAIYPFAGFEQPFFILSEVAKPRKIAPKATITAILTTIVVYMLVNISYFFVVPKESYTESPYSTIDMASAFFHDLFDSTYGSHAGRRVMAGLVSFSIFGNILVFTFSAARVIQEIAKEKLLPRSLNLSTGHTTPWAYFRNGSTNVGQNNLDPEKHLEKSPMAALVLQWFFSVLLITVTAPLPPATAYSLLISLYSYVNVVVLGSLTGGGLLYLKIDSWYYKENGRRWYEKAQWLPFLDPLPAIIYFGATTFLLFAAFVKPANSSPFAEKATSYNWYVVPAIGLSSLLWGVVWWCGMEFVQWQGRYRFERTRRPYLEKDDEQNYVQRVEVVEHWRSWAPNARRRTNTAVVAAP